MSVLLSRSYSRRCSSPVPQPSGLGIGDRAIVGDPFASLGRVAVYKHIYDTLDLGDFAAQFPAGYLVSGEGSLPDILVVTESLQRSVNHGAARFQVRIQFEIASDNDGQADGVLFPEGGCTLSVTYQP